MIGTVIGDVVGSVYEFDNIRRRDFPLFSEDCEATDDSIMAIAVADAIMEKKNQTIRHSIHRLARELEGLSACGSDRFHELFFYNGFTHILSPASHSEWLPALRCGGSSTDATHNAFRRLALTNSHTKKQPHSTTPYDCQ